MKKYLLLFLMIMLLLPAPAAAQEPPSAEQGQMYLLVIDKLGLEDLNSQTTPALMELVKTGSLGLCSSRTLGRGSAEDVCMTIGAGNIARSTKGILALNSDGLIEIKNQTAAQLYRNLTGKEPGESQVVIANFPELVAGMADSNVTSRLGNMGELLKQNGIPVCLLGNGDMEERKSRISAGIATDAEGRILWGNVGIMTNGPAVDRIISTQTNYSYLEKKLNSYKDKPGLKIVELSDLARLEKADVAYPEVQVREKEKTLAEMDGFVDRVAKTLDFNKDYLMIIAPTASTLKIKQKDTFTPIFIKGPDFEEGFLSSGSTRRDYIIAATDIAPTILGFFGIEKDSGTMIGQPIFSAGIQEDHLLNAIAIENRAATVNLIRTPLVKGYVVLQIAIAVLTLFCLMISRRLLPWLLPLILTLPIAPLVFLLLGSLNLPAPWYYIVFAIFGIIITTVISLKLSKNDVLKALAGVAAATLIVLNYDVISGCHLIQSSVLGYDPMSGARYYGIGNEFVGVIIGSSILLAAYIYHRLQKQWVLWLLALYFTAQCVVLAHPSLGTQSDGMITAPIAFLFTLIILSGKKVNLKIAAVVSIIVALALLGGIILDISRPPDLQSHIGRTAAKILEGGRQQGLIVIARKVGMNIKLINYTIWSRVFLVSLGTLAVLFYVPVGAMAMLKSRYPILFKGFSGILTAAIVGGIINDSGIVLAATTSIYLVTPILILMISNLKLMANELKPGKEIFSAASDGN